MERRRTPEMEKLYQAASDQSVKVQNNKKIAEGKYRVIRNKTYQILPKGNSS